MAVWSWWVALGLGSAALALCLHTLFSEDGYPRLQKTQVQLKTLEDDNARIQRQVDRLRIQVNGHKKRADVRARAVRDELNYVESRDVVLDFRQP